MPVHHSATLEILVGKVHNDALGGSCDFHEFHLDLDCVVGPVTQELLVLGSLHSWLNEANSNLISAILRSLMAASR